MKFLLPAVMALNHVGSSYAFGGMSDKSRTLLDESEKNPDLSLQDAVQRMQHSQPALGNNQNERNLQACLFNDVNKVILLLADVSNSVSPTEFNNVRDGMADAFRDSGIKGAILSNGPVAVSLVYWSGATQQAVGVSWTRIGTEDDSDEFADNIATSERPFTNGSTAIGSALQWGIADPNGLPQFQSCPQSIKRIIDIQGDGEDNNTPGGGETRVREIRDAAFAQGIQINGLPILDPTLDLDVYYQNVVITPGGFTQASNDYANFGAAFQSKLEKELLNVDPVAVDDEVLAQQGFPISIDVLQNDSDENGDILTLTSVSNPSFGSAEIVGGLIEYTPNDKSRCGNDSFEYFIEDGLGGMDFADVSVEVNCAPVVGPVNFSADENVATDFDVFANGNPPFDPDGDAMQVFSVGQPFNGETVLNADGTITYEPRNDFIGMDSFLYTISDERGGQSTGIVLVTVNNVNVEPTANDDVVTINEDLAGGMVTIDVLRNDVDPDLSSPPDELTVTIPTNISPFAGAMNGPFFGTARVTTEGQIIYMPDTNFNGTDLFIYQVEDPEGATATAFVVVNVLPVNDAPVARDDSANTMEDTAVLIDVLVNDEDVDDNRDELELTVVSRGSSGECQPQANNTILYTPTSNFNGVDTCTYFITDPSGASSNTATITILVTPVNDGPIARNDGPIAVFEDGEVTVNVLENDSDAELPREVLTVTLASTPMNGFLSLNADQTITYTPLPDFNGEDMFDYTITDLEGATSTATVSIIVVPINDAPIAANDGGLTPEDTPVTIDVLANDFDPDFEFGDGDELTVAVVAGSGPAFGTAVRNANNTITYTPAPNYNGADTFMYVITDLGGASHTASVVILVTPVNDPPMAADDSAVTDEDTQVEINVLLNDDDPDLPFGTDANPADILTVSVPGWEFGPFNGTAVVGNDNIITYTPNLNFYGDDSFTYILTDSEGLTSSAVVTVTVNPINDPPVIGHDYASTPEEIPVIVDVLANDNDPDLPDDVLTVTIVPPGPFHGSIVLNGDQTITYTPNDDYNGPDLFFYNATDSAGESATAAVAILVTPVNEAPVATDDIAFTEENTPVLLDLLFNDIDPDVPPDTLTVSIELGPFFGTAEILPNNTVLYTPDQGFLGNDRFAYTVSDPGGLMSTATAIINVFEGNEAPVALDDFAHTDSGKPVTINVLANDRDFDEDPLVVAIITQPASGTVVVNADHTVTYTPGYQFFGEDSFVYSVTDPDGDSDTATVKINVLQKCASQPRCPTSTDRIYWGGKRRLGGYYADIVPVCLKNVKGKYETVCARLEDITSVFEYDPNYSFISCGCCSSEKEPPEFCY